MLCRKPPQKNVNEFYGSLYSITQFKLTLLLNTTTAGGVPEFASNVVAPQALFFEDSDQGEPGVARIGWDKTRETRQARKTHEFMRNSLTRQDKIDTLHSSAKTCACPPLQTVTTQLSDCETRRVELARPYP